MPEPASYTTQRRSSALLTDSGDHRHSFLSRQPQSLRPVFHKMCGLENCDSIELRAKGRKKEKKKEKGNDYCQTKTSANLAVLLGSLQCCGFTALGMRQHASRYGATFHKDRSTYTASRRNHSCGTGRSVDLFDSRDLCMGEPLPSVEKHGR